MLNRLRSRSTQDLNQITGPAGTLAVDLECKALRVYDSSTQGGFEVLGTPPPLVLPGPSELIAGDLETGFYGEVTPGGFISYEDLSTLVGLSAGTLHNNDESLWLKFSMDDRPCYVAKRTVRYNLSHNSVRGANLVSGDRSVVIGGITYVIRLLTGLVNRNTYRAGGEWNRLLYPIASSQDSLGWGVNIPDADLGVTEGNGRRSWVQETSPNIPSNRAYRGFTSVGWMDTSPSSTSTSDMGWRPILIPVL